MYINLLYWIDRIAYFGLPHDLASTIATSLSKGWSCPLSNVLRHTCMNSTVPFRRNHAVTPNKLKLHIMGLTLRGSMPGSKNCQRNMPSMRTPLPYSGIDHSNAFNSLPLDDVINHGHRHPKAVQMGYKRGDGLTRPGT